MPDVEYAELVEDIREHGLNEPIMLFQGVILDGRHRERACHDAGVNPRYRTFKGSYAEAAAFVLSANAHRRHLSVGQKREVIEALIKASPEKSDRQIAKEAKASPTTVGKVRSTVQAGQLSKRTGADGKARKQRAGGKAPKQPATAKLTEHAKRQDAVALDTREVQARALQQVPGPDSSNELDRLRARLDELGQQSRQLKQVNDAQVSEIEELHEAAKHEIECPNCRCKFTPEPKRAARKPKAAAEPTTPPVNDPTRRMH